MKILVLDTETTGLDIIRHEIIQLGFYFVEINKNMQFVVLEEKEINIKPLHIETADAPALAINGFSEVNWKNSKPINFYFDDIKYRIESADILLGQNLIFDLRFIKQAFENSNISVPKFPPYMDTKWMGIQLLNEGKLKSSSMDRMCKELGIKFEGKAHTALVDCKRTFLVWERLSKQIEDIPAFTFVNCYDPHANKNK